MKNQLVTLFIASCLCTLFPLTAISADGTASTPPLLLEKPSLVLPQSPAAASKPVKIGYIDITRIGLESEYGKSVKAGLLNKKKELEDKVIGKRKQLDKIKQSIEAKLPTLSPKQREAKSKEFQKKVDEFQKLAQSSEEEFIKLQESETTAVYGVIEKTVSEYGKTSDLSLVMVKKDLLYIGSGVEPQDITETVLKLVNEQWKKK